MPLMAEGQPPAWSSYVSVADAGATAAAVKEAGGTVIAEPMDVMDLGRMAVFADPRAPSSASGRPARSRGGVVNEPVSLSWNELNTRDPDAEKEFYGAVFGWSAEDSKMPDGTPTPVAPGRRRRNGRGDARHARPSPDEIPPTGWSISPSPIATRPWKRSRSWAANSTSGRWTSRSGASPSSLTPGAHFAVIALSERNG